MKSVKEAYRLFVNRDFGAGLYNAFKRILYTEEDSLVQTLSMNVLQNLHLVRKKNVLDVCDIGGGDGKRITLILRYLHTKFRITFRLDLVEQSKIYIDAFDTRPIDDFCETRKIHNLFEDALLERRYDLVLLIHSIFALDSTRGLDKVLSLNKPGGKVVIVSNSPDSFLAGLKAIVDVEYEDKRYEIDAVQRELDKRGIRYSDIGFRTRWAIAAEDYENELGIILDWISLGSSLTWPPERRRLVSEYVLKNTVTFEGRRLFDEEEVVLVIPPV